MTKQLQRLVVYHTMIEKALHRIGIGRIKLPTIRLAATNTKYLQASHQIPTKYTRRESEERLMMTLRLTITQPNLIHSAREHVYVYRDKVTREKVLFR